MNVENKEKPTYQEEKLQQSKPFEKQFKKILKKPKLAISIVLILVIVFGAFIAGKGTNFKVEEKTVHLSFEDIGKLSTQEAYVTKVEAMTKDRKFFGTDVKIPMTDTVCIFSLDFVVTASYDFETIKPEIVSEPTDSGKPGKIVIVLPEPEVETGTKSSSEKVFYDKESIFSNISEKEKANVRAEMEKSAEQEAKEKGLIDRAKNNAQKLLTNFINNLFGKGKYQIEFK